MAFGSSNWSKPSGKRQREPLDAAALYEYAVRSLGRKMRTVAELKTIDAPACRTRTNLARQRWMRS